MPTNPSITQDNDHGIFFNDHAILIIHKKPSGVITTQLGGVIRGNLVAE